ncbi:single-stranded DNA-binding protein [Pseudonocardia spinosispora]|uniref:single-stranded DNA-binding protein n=1 Tax=Pseudonocardia spinosispora TaxID=103441 RepID=UPI0003FE4283|nr:single-stranded DNA-binding protein [Pseudonocardia spinosispora]
MTGLPEVTVTGTLTATPELRFTPSGHAVANFTVAANERRYDKNTGQWADGDATFLRCSIWREAAENVTNSLNKGNRVIVTGRLKQRTYDTAEGEKRTVFELDVTEIGPSLKWATATVNKATRTNTTAGAPKAEDPWGAAPAASSDEPPF